MKTVKLDFLKPDEIIFSGMVRGVTVDAVDGKLQILPGHAPYINLLKNGEVIVDTLDSTCQHYKCKGGIIRAEPKGIQILVEG